MTENQETNHDATSAESLPEIMMEYEKKYVEFLGRRQEILPLNKTAIFRVLTAAGIDTVTVSFDGYGDSGQIESIEAYNGNDPVALPDQTIDYQKAAWGESEIEQTSFAIRDAIETMAYEFLSQTHCGWWSRDKALYPVARASFLIPLAEPDVQVSLHPALYVRLTPQVDLIIG